MLTIVCWVIKCNTTAFIMFNLDNDYATGKKTMSRKKTKKKKKKLMQQVLFMYDNTP